MVQTMRSLAFQRYQRQIEVSLLRNSFINLSQDPCSPLEESCDPPSRAGCTEELCGITDVSLFQPAIYDSRQPCFNFVKDREIKLVTLSSLWFLFFAISHLALHLCLVLLSHFFFNCLQHRENRRQGTSFLSSAQLPARSNIPSTVAIVHL
jgi:hypothetical protein